MSNIVINTGDQQHKYCQSCGMQMSKDPKKGGTNIDGSKNEMYCSYCFEGGRFREESLTVDGMKERAKRKFKEMGFPSFLAGFMTRGIPNLKRWKAKG